jgi:hypothetical protein
MAKSLKEMKTEITAKEGTVNRFNKKRFEAFCAALLNEPEFKAEVAKKVGDDVNVEEILPSQEFRKWLKKIVEKMGVDKTESARILTPEFEISSVEGLYDFMSEAIYQYIEAGNKFDFIPKKDFQGSVYLKDVDKTVTQYDARNPRTGESLGTFESTKEKHKILAVKTTCPSWLSKRKKLK